MGGGSGGHVTPVVAVLQALKKEQPKAQVRFWCDTKFESHAKSTVHHFDPSLRVDTIYAGKLRRYHTLSWWQHLQPSILVPNIRDIFLLVIGFIQSFVKLLVWRPDVVFTKGGFVCLPVGAAAAMLRIPLVIHDSDAHPGLTNRILARLAKSIATGAPLEYYPYPKKKSHYIGIPISPDSAPYPKEKQIATKQSYGLDPKQPLIVVTGGGLGAKRINDATIQILDDLLKEASVVLVSGSGQYDQLSALTPNDDPRFQLHAFVTPLVPLLGAADIVVARAGATTLLELAALAKPTILVPNAALTGGHQLKNAVVYQDKGAVKVVDEATLTDNPAPLLDEIHELLANSNAREALGRAIHSFAKPKAAEDLAHLILGAARR